MNTPAKCEGWRVRRAAPEDGDAVYSLGETIASQPLMVRYGVAGQRLGGELRALVADRTVTDQHLLVAEAAAAQGSGELAGFARVLAGGRHGGQFGRGGYLKLIALRPGYEGRGIGKLLLDAVEKTVAEGSPDLFLLASDFNHGAHRFYERSGYRRVGELPEFVCAGVNEVIYWKRLRR